MAHLFDKALGGRILRLAGPVVLAMLSQTAINLLDTIMVGRLDPKYSTTGQAAISHSLILVWMFGGFLSALAVGTQAITARRFGADDFHKSGQVLTNSLLLAVVAGALFSVLGWYLTPLIFPFFNPNADVIREGIPYSQVRMLGVLSMVATVSFKAFYDGVGRTRVHMGAALVMNVLNLVLNWLLIFGNLGLPKLNVLGAGIGSAISSYIGLLLMFVWTLRAADRKGYRFYRPRNLNPRVMWEITRLSVPSGLATVFVMSGFALFLKIVADLDVLESARIASDLGRVTADGVARPAIYTAATKLVIDILSISFMSSLAFGTATATLVSQSLGAKRPELAARFGWESVKLGMGIMAVLGGISLLFPDLVLALFSRDPAVIEAARGPLRLMAVSKCLIAAGLILAQALFGAGNTKFVMYVELILHFTCLVPLAWVLGVILEGGLFGVWLAAFIYIFLMAVLMAWKFHEGKWKQIKL